MAAAAAAAAAADPECRLATAHTEGAFSPTSLLYDTVTKRNKTCPYFVALHHFFFFLGVRGCLLQSRFIGPPFFRIEHRPTDRPGLDDLIDKPPFTR